MFLRGLKVKNYRSFDDLNGVELQGLSNINIIIGKNNVGKSNIFRFLSNVGGRLADNNDSNLLNKEDAFNDNFNISYSYFYDLPNEFEGEGLIEIALQGQLVNSNSIKYNMTILHDIETDIFISKMRLVFDQEVIINKEKAIRLFRDHYSAYSRTIPILYIDEFRDLINDKNLISSIKRMQNFKARDNNSKEQYSRLNKFVSDLLEESVVVRVPDLEYGIDIEFLETGETRHLRDVGSGIREVIVLMLKLTTMEDSIVLIEEPETHLHVSLQKRLLSFLNEYGRHQYFIATHSNAFLDSQVEKSMYSFSMHKDGYTIVNKIKTNKNYQETFRELGIYASDLLLSNGIIWVEGASDDIYIRHWIKLYCEENRERIPLRGLNYEILHYNGGNNMLSHYKVLEIEDNEFSNALINILNIQSNYFFIMDRDNYIKSAEKGEPGYEQNKIYLINQINDEQKWWMTEPNGRTIEYYVPDKKNNGFNDDGSMSGSFSKTIKAKGLIKQYNEYKDWFNDSNDLESQIKKIMKQINSWN